MHFPCFKYFKKIFVLCGKKSFVTSGAENLFKKIITDKEIKLFYKKSELPILEELIEFPRTLLVLNIFFMSCKFELHKKVSLNLEESSKTFMVFLFLGKL